MATESGGREPSLIKHNLTVLAQFEDERVVLDQTDIERMADVSSSTAQKCLLTLSELGYLARAGYSRYRLARPATLMRGRHDGDDAAGTTT